MSCAYDKERLTAFFDGELDAVERADTERHISGCSECLRDLGEIKSAASAVKILPRPRAPRSIAEGVSREIAVAGRVHRIDVWRRRLVLGVAAAALLLVALNVSYFTAPPETGGPLAKETLPIAPQIGAAQDQDKASEERKGRKEAAPFEELEKRSADKGNADGAENRARRAAEQEGGRELKKAVDRATPGDNALRQDAKPAPAPKADEAAKKPQAALAAKTEAPAPAPPPSATPPPAPRPAAEPTAKPAPAPAAEEKNAEEARRKLVDGRPAEGKSDKAVELQKQLGSDPAARAPLPEAPAYTVRGGKAAQARAQAEALVKKWSAPEAAAKAGAAPPSAPPAPAAPAKPSVASGAPAGARSFGSADAAPLVVEVTPAQLEELRAELAASGVTLEAGAPEQLLRGAQKDALATGGGAGAGTKERAEQPDALKEVDRDQKAKTAAPTRRITLHFVEAPRGLK